MPEDNNLYRTVVQIEVLSRGPFSYGNLEDIHNKITYGYASGNFETIEQKQVSVQEMKELLEKQDSDPEFILTEKEMESLI